MERHYLYILECVNKAYYTGYTNNIRRRYQEHLQGSKKCKYTRSFPPRRLAACWSLYSTRAAILKLERAVKKLSLGKKLILIAEPTRVLLLIKQQKIRDDIKMVAFAVNNLFF